MNDTHLENTNFEYIRKLVHERAAIVLEEGKKYLVEARLAPLAQREGFSSVQTLVAKLRAAPFNGLHQDVIEAMTTNETSFFRDRRPFEVMRNHVLPALLAKKADWKELAIWCAACATGQEAYSVAMLLQEHFGGCPGWSVRILASDISNRMLARAQEGRYSQLEVNRGLPATLLVKYFQKDGLDWQLRDHIRRMVEFRQLNLAGAWPAFPLFDLVLMRNVLIYFDLETKKRILARLRTVTRPGSYLFLGTAETTLSIDDTFVPVHLDRTTCYRTTKL